MVEYDKPWLSLDEQIDRLVEHGLEVEDEARATRILAAIGYYRITGYLYPFRASEERPDEGIGPRIRLRLRGLVLLRGGIHCRSHRHPPPSTEQACAVAPASQRSPGGFR